jgi:hypothetical protein
MLNTNIQGTFGVNNAVIPSEGPKAVPVIADFNNDTENILDGEQIVSQGKIAFFQGMYVDNGSNPVPATFIMEGTNQRIIVPANTQGYYSILQTNNPRITVQMQQAANRTLPIIFYNVPIQQHNWTTQ